MATASTPPIANELDNRTAEDAVWAAGVELVVPLLPELVVPPLVLFVAAAVPAPGAMFWVCVFARAWKLAKDRVALAAVLFIR